MTRNRRNLNSQCDLSCHKNLPNHYTQIFNNEYVHVIGLLQEQSKVQDILVNRMFLYWLVCDTYTLCDAHIVSAIVVVLHESLPEYITASGISVRILTVHFS